MVDLRPDNGVMAATAGLTLGCKIFHSEALGIGLAQQPEVGCRTGEYMEKDSWLFPPLLHALCLSRGAPY